MQIHEVVYNATLQIILNAVYDDLFANVHDFEICILVFISVLIDGLIRLLIFANAIEKVLSSGLGVLAAIVWAGSLYVTNIRHDDVLIIALAFDKQDFNAIFDADFVDPFPALFGRIGRIEDRNDSSGAKPG